MTEREREREGEEERGREGEREGEGERGRERLPHSRWNKEQYSPAFSEQTFLEAVCVPDLKKVF